jgi:hypothetical protein
MPVTSPSNSKPFLVPTGTDLTGLTAYLMDLATGSDIPMPDLALHPLAWTAPAGRAWVQLTGLPDLMVLSVAEAVLTVVLTSDGSTCLQDSVTTASTGLAGPNPVTVIVQDSLTNAPLMGVDLAVWSQDLQTLVAGPLRTDQSGQALFGLPVGTFQTLAFASGAAFANPFQTVVSGGPSIKVIAGTKQVIGVPAPDKVTIYGYVLAPSGTPLSGVAVKLTLDTTTPQMLENVAVGQDSLTIQTNELGYFELSVFGGLKITLAIDNVNFSKSGTLPATGLVSLEQLNVLFQ